MTQYACTNCGIDKPKEELTAKKVMFTGIGQDASVFRSRIVDWLCEVCLGADSQYNSEANTSRADRMKSAQSRRKASQAGR